MTDQQDIGTMFGASNVETFLGLPKAVDIHSLGADIALISAPCATPYPSVGAYCADGPKAIRQAMAPYSANLQHFDFDLGGPLLPSDDVTACDCGDLACDPDRPAENRDLIRHSINAILDQQAVPVLFGGDDSIPIPMFEAYAGRGEFVILQIDAHIDWRDEVNGERFGLSSNMRRASEMPHIRGIIQVGQRALGSARPQDRQDALDWGVKFVSARDVAKQGIEPVLDLVPKGANIIFALDCDALDPSFLPGVIGRAPGGLTYWQVVELIQGAAARAKIAGFEIMEFMPQRDVDQIGALTTARIIANAVGAIARQR